MASLIGHTSYVRALQFSPDSKTLASGSNDTTVLLWDVGAAQLDFLWGELLADEGAATGAAHRLAANPAKVVPLMKARLAKASSSEVRVARLVARLDDDDFETREKATKQLQGAGPEAAYILRGAVEGSGSEEIRKRVGRVLEALAGRGGESPDRYAPQRLRVALRLLERMDAAEARQTLVELSAWRRGGEYNPRSQGRPRTPRWARTLTRKEVSRRPAIRKGRK